MADALNKKRNFLKQKITIALCSVEKSNVESVESCLEILEACLTDISKVDNKLDELSLAEEEVDLSEEYNAELKDRVQYK